MQSSNSPIIPTSAESPPGMKTLYADRSGSHSVSYIPDIVYDTRAGLPLHLQMLYPSPQPMGLMMKIMREQNPERFPPEDKSKKSEATSPPPMPQTKHPLVVYVQGSAWGKQDCKRSLPNLVEIARQGYAIASVEYRPSNVAPWPGFLCDVKAAIRYLRQNAELFGIDPARIAVWGDSSGGHTALLVGSTGWTKEFDDGLCSDQSSAVSAAISFYGLSDISKINDVPRNPMYVNSPENMVPENILLRTNTAEHPEACAPANPINYIHKDKNYPPFLLLHGDEDDMVPFNQSVLMYNKLVETEKQVDFYKVKGAGHGRHFWTKEVLETVIQFLRAYV